MHYSLAASTSDAVRVWSLDIAKEAGSHALANKHHERRRSTALAMAADANPEPTVVSTIAEGSAETASHSIHEIACLSWANDGSTYVVGGAGSSCIRQYSSDGTHIQDIKLNARSERASLMDIVSVQHYGSKSESLFVANNSVRQVRRWDFVKKDYTATCQTHTNDISCMAVSTKKRLVVSATSQGGEIAVFNLLHNTRSDLLSATHRSLTCLDISSSHRSQIAVGSEDGLLQLFDNARSSAAPVKTYSSVHMAPVRGIAFHPTNTSVIISVGLDGRIIATDSNAYSSNGANGGSNGSAMNIDAGAPLTCLTSSSDPFAVGAGTIDGDVLFFDMRAARSPLWRSTVGVRRAVTSLSLSQCNSPTRSNGATDTLRYSQTSAASLQEDDLGSTGYASSVRGDTMADIFSNDRDSTPSQPLARGTPRSSFSWSADPVAKADTARPPLRSDDKQVEDDDMIIVDENASIMRNDRSFMDLLSPEKAAAKTTYEARKAALDSNRENFLTTLSRNRGHAVAPSATNPRFRNPLLSKEPSWLTRTTGKAGAAKTPSHSKTPYDRDFARPYPKVSARASIVDPSPIPKPIEPTKQDEPADPYDLIGRIQSSNTHDTGDSMMEMFTPERKKPAVTDNLFLIPEADEDKDDCASGALLPLREQLSGEIRNLHLDMIRQDFVYQEQIRVLRAECCEARALRSEIDQLRRENEQLKRYLPFYNFTEADMPTPSADSAVQGQPAMSDCVALPDHGVYTVFVELGNTKIELLHPYGDKSPIAGFLTKNKSGGIHHVCINVSDITAALASLKTSGVRALSEEPKIGAHGLPVVFLHPKDCGGVLVELEEHKSNNV
ncbi:hypothetical protein LPJ53_002986 [Coemansia erecta]|uniref:VOC domain-containing protein n=1 Tax=Coemansia erecta TaxID=147472 RepID=A0A9W8CT88_9FUNG|nr:hypothetical protein LPJ53_002986 [Coemansia erecta]